jgi:hypothetical protein
MTGAGGGVSGFDPPRAHAASPPLRSPKKKRREAGEIASRRVIEANTGNLLATLLEKQSLCQSMKAYKNNGLTDDEWHGRVTRIVTLQTTRAQG